MERLVVPTDFLSPGTEPRSTQENLVPPSHFASSIKPAGKLRSVQIPPPISWIKPVGSSVPSGDPTPADSWLAISQAQQEILELRRENQRMMKLHRDNLRGATSVDQLSDHRARSTDGGEQWSRSASEWQLEVEKHKAEAGRLKGQVETLRDTAETYRDELRDRDAALTRRSHEVETMREELSKTKRELSRVREELSLSSAQKEKISSQLETLKVESSEDIAKLRRGVEISEEASREMAERAEEGARQQTLRLSQQLEATRKQQEIELQQLSASHCAELDAARKTNRELQDRLQSITSEVLQLKSALMEVSAERDGLKEHLSQMGQAFETQSATLHSLRNYIGQLAPEKGEKERLNQAVEKLNKEKADLLMTTELLTVRLNSLSEILTLQEEKLMKKASSDPLVKNGCDGLRVLQLWRENVYKLCIQLRFKDIELRREKGELLSKVASTEQQLQQEQHQASVLQHSLHDRIAELDLERMEKEALKEDLDKVQKENAQLTSCSQTAEAEIQTLTDVAQRFSQTFESKLAEVAASKAKLSAFTQRLTFAQRRVETIQALVMRSAALQRVEQACKQTEEVADRNFETEHSLVCEERDRLSRELKRTPELIEKALADLKQQYESKVEQQQQELQQAVAGREAAEQSLLHSRAQLEENKVDLERLRCELLHQREHSEQDLKERVSEIEERCAAKLREMEVQVDTARREHTKAVMTLRGFEREAARRQDEIKEPRCLESENTERRVLNKYLTETESEKNLLPAAADPRGLNRERAGPHTTARKNCAALRKQPHKPPERSFSEGAKVHPASDERLLCVLEELHTLSAAVVNSSEDSAEEEEEEEGQSDSAGPATGSRHS